MRWRRRVKPASQIIECGILSDSMLSRQTIDHAYFRDSYRMAINLRELDIAGIFFAIFAHHPMWMNFLLIIRNEVASLADLDTSTAAEVLPVEIRQHYTAGEKIGVWTIFALSENEIIAGRDNKHMDFRLSVLKSPDGDKVSVIVSTICTTHNRCGKIQLFFIVPVHRYGVQKLMANALAAGRQ